MRPCHAALRGLTIDLRGFRETRLMVSLAVLLEIIPVGSPASEIDLTDLSLEELVNLEVTSVSKRPEHRSGAAAAIAVISGGDVRRSGATSIPEALRMAPGLHVARVTSSEWAVASRGFSSLNSAKLLVLIDGRSVYTPLFSGVFWEVQDTLLEDLDQIEVIRGPGASLWGANAMNGVINVTTKSARKTHGAYVEGGGGTEDRAFGAVRYGGKIGESVHYRVFGKYLERDAGFSSTVPEDDDWWMGRGGFRIDWAASQEDDVTFQGDLYQGEIGQVVPAIQVTGRPEPPRPLEADLAGGNLLTRWRRSLGEGTDVEVQAYYDRTHRDDPTFRDVLDTFDVQLQYSLPLRWRQEVLWGVAYRLMSNDFRGKGIADLRPGESNDQLLSGFVQDQIELLEGALRFTIGTKLEHNDFSGFEVQPTGRVAWDPAERCTLWGAVSRAVRVPTRIERDVSAQAGGPSDDPLLVLIGNSNLHAEDMASFELGWRQQLTPDVFLDVAGFYNDYEQLITFEFRQPRLASDGRTILPLFSENAVDGTAYGAETSLTWFPWPFWHIVGSYGFLRLQLEPDPGRLDLGGVETFERDSPRHQVHLRSSVDLPAGLAFDVLFRYVDHVGTTGDPALGVTPKFMNVDVRLGWEIRTGIEISAVGQNLVYDHREEFPGGTEVQRAMYAKVAVRY